MSRTLNLVDRLLARGRRLHRLGATHEALRTFGRLTAFRELPPAVARRAQAHLARIHLRGRRPARARRHLAALLLHDPKNAAYHYRMARAAAADPRCDRGRALEHCRRATQLAPRHGGYLSTFGILAVRQGRVEEGLGALCRAVELAPHDPRVLGRLVRGLCLADRGDLARPALLAGLFRNGTDGRFRRLWCDFQFGQLRLHQQRTRRREADAAHGPALLPFIRSSADEPAAEAPADVRVDAPSVLPGPHQPRSLRRRHAQ
jgi:tetratricopeptide (TPR) repeat protein